MVMISLTWAFVFDEWPLAIKAMLADVNVNFTSNTHIIIKTIIRLYLLTFRSFWQYLTFLFKLTV